jgi:integrase
MPKQQAGSVVKRSARNYGARYMDVDRRRRYQGGFETQSAAEAWLRTRVAEVAALRRGDPAATRRTAMPTLRELAAEYTTQHVAEPSTITSLQARLRYALLGPRLDGQGGWQDVRIDHLNPADIGAWRRALPYRSGHGIHKALRQVLHYAVRTKLLAENPAVAVPNPTPKRAEVQVFTLDELDAVAAELLPPTCALPVFGALTGLRPCEWAALERGDVDRQAGAVHVRRTVVDGRVRPYAKTERSLRGVPLPTRAADSLAGLPVRLDTRLLFPALRGGPTNLQDWRWRKWNPALRAAGVAHRTPYALRHTYASLSIAAGVSLFELARLMGTSPAMIDATYGHLLPDALDRARTALDTFVAERSGTYVAQP